MDMPDFSGEEVDICIVGSGAGGAPVAYTLAKAGAKVVVLEKGPWYKRGDFDHDEIKNCRRNYWAPYVADEPHLIQTSADKAPRATNEGWIANCVGGGTVHMSGFFYRLHPVDFAMKSRYGAVPQASLADWPISYEDLSPYYDRVEREMGLSGKAFAHPYEPPRSSDYPLPPLGENPLHILVEEGARKLGLHPYPTPRGILSRPYRGREACVYCDFCGSYGCESGAKSSTLAALIPRALDTGRCEVRAHSMAFEIGVDSEGGARSVRYFDAEGNEREQKARLVCVSATAIESARLLLNSQSARFPKGLSNSNGLVGQNLTFSTLGKGFGVFERQRLSEPLREPHPIHFLQRSIRDFYVIADKKGAYDKGGTLGFLLPHRNPIYTAERIASRSHPKLWGESLQRALHRYYHDVHELEFEIYGEFLANPKTFVSVEGTTKDKWGLPVATIHLHNHPEDVANSAWMVKKGLEVFEQAGASETYSAAVGGTTFILQHGTCRFGKDPEMSVLNANCRSHEVPNLFVVDGSFMPTSGGVPSTLTIMANAFRVADHMVQSTLKRQAP